MATEQQPGYEGKVPGKEIAVRGPVTADTAGTDIEHSGRIPTIRTDKRLTVTAPGWRQVLRRFKDYGDERVPKEKLGTRIAHRFADRFSNGSQRRADGVPVGYKLVEPNTTGMHGKDFREIIKELEDIPPGSPLSDKIVPTKDASTKLVFQRFDVIVDNKEENAQNPRVYKRRGSRNRFYVAADKGTTLQVDVHDNERMKISVPEGTEIRNNWRGENSITQSKDLWRAPVKK